MSRNNGKAQEYIREFFKSSPEGTYEQIHEYCKLIDDGVKYESVSRTLRQMASWGVLAKVPVSGGVLFRAIKKRLEKPVKLVQEHPDKMDAETYQYILVELNKKLDRANASANKDIHLIDTLTMQMEFYEAGLKGTIPKRWMIWKDHKNREDQLAKEATQKAKLLK